MVLSSNRHKIGGHVIVKLLVGLRSSLKFGHVVVVVCIPVCASGGGSAWTLLREEAVLGEVWLQRWLARVVIYCAYCVFISNVHITVTR